MTYDENNSPIPCPDLRTLFGGKFKTGRDPAFSVEHGRLGRVHDPWMQTVLCENGHIYPHGPDLLAASTNNAGLIAKRLASLDCTTIVQDGSDGMDATFHIQDFDLVAEVMRPRRKHRGRVMTPEEMAKLVAAGKQHRFTPGSQAGFAALESPRRPQQVSNLTQPNPNA